MNLNSFRVLQWSDDYNEFYVARLLTLLLVYYKVKDFTPKDHSLYGIILIEMHLYKYFSLSLYECEHHASETMPYSVSLFEGESNEDQNWVE